MSKIEWTDKTLNPIVGCTPVSPACDNCYAVKMAYRHSFNPKPGIASKYKGTAKKTKDGVVWTGKLNFRPEVMRQVLNRKTPTKYFVGSMTDLFHDAVPDELLDRLFTIMARASHHTFQILTKRPERMRKYLEGCERGAADIGGEFPWSNVWFGVTAENQAMANKRIPILLATPAAVRFVSIEPMLGPVDLRNIAVGCPAEGDILNAIAGIEVLGDAAFSVPRLDWVICGGETGNQARPMFSPWVRRLRAQCTTAGVPFFFKKWGGYKGRGDWLIPAGHEVDGQVWEQFPEVRHA